MQRRCKGDAKAMATRPRARWEGKHERSCLAPAPNTRAWTASHRPGWHRACSSHIVSRPHMAVTCRRSWPSQVWLAQQAVGDAELCIDLWQGGQRGESSPPLLQQHRLALRRA